jgi:RNA recognition motif-containing protein
MNIYVGNLPYTVRNPELRSLFEKHGAVDDAEVVIDRRTNRSRGYGFVRMKDETQARAAVKALNGFELHGRRLRVDESKPKDEDDRQNRRGARAGKQEARESKPAARAAASDGGIIGFFRRLFR